MDPAAAQLAAFEALVDYLTYERHIVDYVFMSAAGLLGYEFCLTIYDEITLIWQSPWSYTKVLFLLVRYIPFFSISLMIYDQISLGRTVEQCNKGFPALIWFVMFGIILAEVILMIRTWAVWRQNKIIGCVLAVLQTATLAASIYGNVKFVRALQISPPPIPGFRGCFVTATSNTLRVDFLTLSALQLIVLSLMCVAAFKAYKLGSVNELSRTIHRDGIMIYVYLLLITIANVTCMYALPTALAIMMAPLQAVLYSVLTCRIVFKIRSVGRKDTLHAPTELHGYHFGTNDTGATPLAPMKFKAPDRSETGYGTSSMA